MVKVSVIIPTYKGARYLSESIESVLNQSFKDFELVIVYQPSGDGSGEIIESFDDPRIRVIQTEPGLPRCYNVGLDNSRGDYISMLDHDDVFLPRKLEKQVRVLDEITDVFAVTSSTIYIDNDGSIDTRASKVLGSRDSPGFDYYYHVDSYMIHSSLMFRRTDLRYDEAYMIAADMKFGLELFYGNKVYHFNEPLVCYRRHDDSVMRSNGLEDRYDEVRGILSDIKVKYNIGTLSYMKAISSHCYHICGEYYVSGRMGKSLRLIITALLFNPMNRIVFRGIYRFFMDNPRHVSKPSL